jgi:hypothetical protein
MSRSYETLQMQLFEPPTISFLFGLPLLSLLFSYTLGLCFSLNVTDQVSHPHKTAGKIIVLYILIFTFITQGKNTRDSEKNCIEHCLDLIYP